MTITLLLLITAPLVPVPPEADPEQGQEDKEFTWELKEI